jgi:hypothetical protein
MTRLLIDCEAVKSYRELPQLLPRVVESSGEGDVRNGCINENGSISESSSGYESESGF